MKKELSNFSSLRINQIKNKSNFFKVAVFFFIFFVLCSAYYFKRIYQPWGTCDTDFSVFTSVGQAIALKEDIYLRCFLETGVDFYKYSPVFAVMMIPLSKLHRHLSVPIWYLSIFIFFISSIFFTKKILLRDNPEKDLSKAFYIFAILMSLRFLLSVIQRVQSDALVLFLLALFIFALFYNKQAFAGIALGAACMVKLTPLIFVPYLLLKKKFKAAGACSLALIGYVFAPALYLGWLKNLEYLKNWFIALTQKVPADYFLWYKNQSLFSCLMRFFSPDSPKSIFNLDQAYISIIFIVLAACLCGLIFMIGKKPKHPASGFSYLAEISLVLICMILFSPLAWKHTFLHLIIPHLVLLYYTLYINPADRAVRALLIASFVMNTVLNPDLTKPIDQLLQEYSIITWGTLLLFAGLFRVNYKLCKH
ncbi:glycosyltransferase family 87 protein [Candidatus Omnitrophota bacterium]